MNFEKPLLFTRPPIWAVFAIAITIVTVSVINTSTIPLFPTQRVVPGDAAARDSGSVASKRSCAGFFRGGAARAVTASIREFGGVGDGRTSNTEAFRRALRALERFGDKGGSRLNVPEGRWVTGSFNLTSNFTLFLERGAVILGSQNEEEWPVIEPLLSYGRGRERLGGRHISLIHGDSLTNVVITGENGTIDGQGRMWWDLWWNRSLEHTRGHQVELKNSHNVLISNLTFINSAAGVRIKTDKG
ncbi:hypothetical protein Sjap_021760 [Stephania japonica]|uniref:Polygalacturonase n=1 Tax=Stephania japonica TaxID=461633 RepID=A0AAP0EUS5_9MAGN